MPSQSYTVTGMSCGHCVASVTEELRTLPGVRKVEVDLASGRVDLSAESPLEDSEVRRAVTEAGYQLAPARG